MTGSYDGTAPVVVLGAAGGVGSHVLEQLVARGVPARAVTRTGDRAAVERMLGGPLPASVQVVAADVTDTATLGPAVEGAAAVVHAAQPPYTDWDRFPVMTNAIADATARAGARLVLADNLYMYGPTDGPMTESTPQRATDHKGRIRTRMAADLLARHAAGDLPVTLGRASDYYGPRGRGTALGDPVFARALSGKPAQWVGRLDQPHTMSYLPDVGRALVELACRPDLAGRAWHLPAAEPLTGRAFLDLVGTELGRPVKARPSSARTLRVLGLVVPMLRELAGVAHQWDRPFVADDSALRAAVPGLGPTPHREAVAATVRWWRAALASPAGD